jgi:hypothetical protein
MRRSLVTLAILGSLLSPATAAATDNGTVSAEVTVVAPCITVGPNIDYGTLPFNTPGHTVMERKATSYTNCSGMAEKVYARGTAAVSASSDTTWQLAPGSGLCMLEPNHYGHRVIDQSINAGFWTTTTDNLLNSAVAAGATVGLATDLMMACSGSDGAGETMTFSIILTATF